MTRLPASASRVVGAGTSSFRKRNDAMCSKPKNLKYLLMPDMQTMRPFLELRWREKADEEISAVGFLSALRTLVKLVRISSGKTAKP
jgi:hypothetical protein